ncbi:MAG: LysR family transcriptional regulator [Anaerolineae bacterium]|nr:LysR family transcriptional regulator [Anaerolineae bacterium]
MELRQLRAFERVVSCGSFSRAADELALSQPAVTAQIQALERELGVRLLERLPRRVLTTSAGETLLPYARGLLNLEEDARRALEELRGLQAGTLRVGASPTIGTYLLPSVLGELKRRHPGLRVIAEIQPTHHVAEALETHALDVGLVEAPVASAALAAEPFHSDDLVLVVPAGHPWAARRSIRPGELAGQPLIAREPGSGTRQLVEERLRALGVEAAPALELGAIEAIKNAVAAGLGVAFISRLAIQPEQRLGTLAVVPVKGLDLRRPFYRLLHRRRQPSPAVRAFLDALGGEATT